MNFEKFRRQLIENIPVGTALDNPAKGKSIIDNYSNNSVCYIRGNSKINIKIRELYKAYCEFRGRKVSSVDLREYNPSIFDSKKSGHSCNCTFLFMALEKLCIVDDIEGKGVRGNPFYVKIPE